MQAGGRRSLHALLTRRSRGDPTASNPRSRGHVGTFHVDSRSDGRRSFPAGDANSSAVISKEGAPQPQAQPLRNVNEEATCSPAIQAGTFTCQSERREIH